MKKKKSEIGNLRNQVRGTLSRLRASSTPLILRQSWSQEQLVHQSINQIRAHARAKLSAEQLGNFEKWMGEQLSSYSRSMGESLGRPLTSFGLFPTELVAQSLNVELQLATEELSAVSGSLVSFCKKANAIAQYIVREEWGTAAEMLRETVAIDGYSYWAVETELMLEQQEHGVEKLKSKVSSMSIGGSGLNSFFLYLFGVRNEPAQTSSRFKTNIRRKIEESELSVDLQLYAKYRTYGEVEPVAISLASIIACERLTTKIDLFFTLIKLSRIIVKNPTAFAEEVIATAYQTLDMLSLMLQELELEIGSDCSADSGVIGLVVFAIRRVFECEMSLASLPKYEQRLVYGLSSHLSTRSDGVAAEELSKYLLNLSWLPRSIAFSELDLVPKLPAFLIRYQLCGVNSGQLNQIIVKVLSSEDNQIDDTLLKELLAPFGESRRAVQNEDGAASIACLQAALCATNNPSRRDALSVVLAHELLHEGSEGESLKVCAEAGMENGKVIPFLPLSEFFAGARWPALKRLGPSLDLAIALDHSLQHVDDRKVRTFKRYSVEELMEQYECKDIAELPAALQSDNLDGKKIEYFFNRVCDPFTLELLPGMGKSRRVQRVRADMLRGLAAMHSKNEMAYLNEAKQIEDDLQVDDGLSVLDDSKVYVDDAAILNFMNKELAADFQRYRKLVSSGVGVSAPVGEVLRGFNKPTAKTFQIPKNDADDLLADMVGSLLQRFLFDTAFGLDTIVSRRIRHGTISGEIRGVLEKGELIGYKASIGTAYGIPLRISRIYSRLDHKQARIASAAYGRFSSAIDQLISRLRDEYFHVKSKTKPRGVFDLQLNPIIISLARSLAQTCTGIEQFTKECVELFWYSLSVRLDALRPTVEAETKKTLQIIFSKILYELRALKLGDATVFADIQAASDELQRRATTIASWIKVSKVILEGNTYDMQRAVDVAIAVVTSQRPTFHPIVEAKVPGDLELDAHGFSIVSDALYIAFSNVAQHSGKKVDNKINIEIIFDSIESLIRFDISSDIAAFAKTGERETQLASIRADIQRRAYGDRVRLDRHSGLFKLAALVGQSEKTSMSFGYVEGWRFNLKFDLVYLGISGPNQLSISPSAIESSKSSVVLTS